MFIIGEAVIDDVVGKASFCCNLKHCKGACCTMPGGRGAPLEDDEVLELQKAYPFAKRYLSRRTIETIEAHGLVDGSPGGYATMCVDHRDCVFVYYDGDIAKCSLERAFEDGTTDWRKPISCHLFPIRVRPFGKDFLRYEQMAECESGRNLGEAMHVELHSFLKEPLTRKYGEPWYQDFLDYCRTRL